MKRLAVGLIGTALLVAAGCARDRAVVSGDVKVAVDDDAPAVSRQQNAGHPTWTMLAPGRVFGDMCRHYDLRKGRHVVRIWKEAGNPVAEGLVLTDNPLSFEPR